MLIARIFINEDKIGEVALQRLGPLNLEGEGWHDYAIRIPCEHAGKVVRHRYKDGWRVLLRMAIETMEGGKMGKVTKDMMSFAGKAKEVMDSKTGAVWYASKPGFYPRTWMALRWGEKGRDLLVLEVIDDLGIVLEEWLEAPKMVSTEVAMLKNPAETLAYIDALIVSAEREASSPGESSETETGVACGLILAMLQRIRQELFGSMHPALKKEDGAPAPGLN
jgi:hypothetical protein